MTWLDLDFSSLSIADKPTSTTVTSSSSSGVLLILEEAPGGSGGVALSIRPLAPSVTAGSTAIVFDERVCGHRDPSPLGHPERPERVGAVSDALRTGGMANYCVSVPARLVTRAEVELVHEINHWDHIEFAVSQELSAIEKFAAQHESLYLNGKSMESARCAAGGVLELVEQVMSGKARNGMALVRPPGHHAEAHTAMGFCVFNTCAIAAAHARKSLNCRRVLIVDWDIHHGNGIQHMFESDPDVLYFSVHRYERGQYFPSAEVCLGSDGAPSSAGIGNGRGTSVNIGWNTRGYGKPGDAEYLAAWKEVLLPISREFDPDLVIVAAGFDAAEGDPLGQCKVTPECYASLTRDLMTLANGKVVLALEGGYSLSATAASAAGCMEALLGMELRPLPSAVSEPPPPPRERELRSTPLRNKRQSNVTGPPARLLPRTPKAAKAAAAGGAASDTIDRGARRAIDETRAVHSEYWKCLQGCVPTIPPSPLPAPTSARKAAAAAAAANPPSTPAASMRGGTPVRLTRNTSSSEDLESVAMRLAGIGIGESADASATTAPPSTPTLAEA